MKFFHLSDIHIGKSLHNYNLKEDQIHILNEIVLLAREQHPDAIVVAGDIYDKSVPSAESVSIFDGFLTQISAIEPPIPMLMIAGNHDSPERLLYAGEILNRHHIHIAGLSPRTQEEKMRKITLTDVYGEVVFYLLPFTKPGYVRGIFEEEPPENYEDAIRKLLLREEIDMTKRNVLVTHQFYTGGTTDAETCDSENFHVGGVENVGAEIITSFDYAALGHLHGAQQVGRVNVQYCGTPLKYSVSEEKHKKGVHVVTLLEKGALPMVEELPLHPLRDVKKIVGTLEEILKEAGKKCDDYVSIVLTDEKDPYRPKEQLERVFSHILEIRMDNRRTRQRLSEKEEEISIEDPLTLFGRFYREIQGRDLEEDEETVLLDVLEKVREE